MSKQSRLGTDITGNPKNAIPGMGFDQEIKFLAEMFGFTPQKGRYLNKDLAGYYNAWVQRTGGAYYK